MRSSGPLGWLRPKVLKDGLLTALGLLCKDAVLPFVLHYMGFIRLQPHVEGPGVCCHLPVLPTYSALLSVSELWIVQKNLQP